MFTGIIEEIGIVKEFKKGSKNALITVACKNILEGTKIGDSIAINGICQTVTALTSNSFSAEISSETLAVTNFSSTKTGEQVNLERALTLSSRLGGHVVTGHIDGLAEITQIKKIEDFYNLKFKLKNDLTKYTVSKGSITINGISLTIAKTSDTEFEVAIIPHTFENTNLKNLKTGDFVNIEMDILAKYVEKILSTGNNVKNMVNPTKNTQSAKINENFLKENGFF